MSMHFVSKPKVIAIIGPTASGKSDLAVALARQLNGEVVSADSRQVYKGLDIGSGKVPRDKDPKSYILYPKFSYIHKGIPHCLLDVASPKRTFTVAQYQKLATKAIHNILRRGKLPIICGGTGFYIDALLHDYPLPNVKPNLTLRRELEKRSPSILFEKLRQLDPRRAKTIDRHNKRRLVRALEIVLTTKKAVPHLSRVRKSSYDFLKIGISLPPQKLKERIHKRLVARLQHGMIAEVKKLRAQGVSWKRLDDLGLEYRYVSRYLRGLLPKEAMIGLLDRETRHYAKRQMTWWRKQHDIVWVRNTKDALRVAQKFLLASQKAS